MPFQELGQLLPNPLGDLLPQVDRLRWIEPTLLNSWVNYGSTYATAAYTKLPSGLVLIRGLIRDGTYAGSTIFTLPVGFRPVDAHIFEQRSANGSHRIDVKGDGDVVATASGDGGTWVSLAGIIVHATT